MATRKATGEPQAWRYDGKQVVVTGCSSGMGAATALLLAELGAEVTGLDRKEPAAEVRTFHHVDLADAATIDAVVARLGRVDALFNCAGISNGAGGSLDVMRVNVIGLRHLTEAVIPLMGEGGAIASIASLGGQGWEQNLASIVEFLSTDTYGAAVSWCERHPEQFTRGGYAFSKQSVIVYSKRRCVDLAGRGIRINVISPGVTETPMLVDTVRAMGKEALNQVPAPLGRRSLPLEQARVLAFLNSSAASYVTGQNLWTDAGFMGGFQTGVLGALEHRR